MKSDITLGDLALGHGDVGFVTRIFVMLLSVLFILTVALPYKFIVVG